MTIKVPAIIVALLMFSTTLAQGACPIVPGLHFLTCRDDVRAELLVPGRDELPQPGSGGLTVAGAYSSADRFGIEGLALHRGVVASDRYQSWDGIALINADGVTTLANRRSVPVAGTSYDLDDPAERAAFLRVANQNGLSLIQSHLLISDGVLDTRPSENAPRFKRRLLFTLPDGSLGLYDTPAAMTLHDTALHMQTLFAPEMVLNLDMGSYDYCMDDREELRRQCGTLAAGQTAKLTNLLHFFR